VLILIDKRRAALKRIVILCLFFLGFSAVVYCSQESKIELTDGSIINGEIVSYASGVYVLDTPAFGVISVESAKVSRIEPVNRQLSGIPAGPTVPSASFSQSDINNYKQKIMNNPATASLIAGMAFDSRIQELAEDPQIQDAVKSGDIQALMKNEKFMNIVNNPKMQESIKKLKQ
jgi:hypothetical protein